MRLPGAARRDRTALAAKSRKAPRSLLPIAPKEILHAESEATIANSADFTHLIEAHITRFGNSICASDVKSQRL
jgi:hypothetical protein